MLPHPLSAVIVVLLAAAAVSDATRHRIPNGLPVSIAACAVGGRLLGGELLAAGASLAALLLVGALLFPAWSRRAIGGGDLKLAAAAAAWVGLAALPRYLLASALAGGVLAVGCYLASAKAARREMRSNLLLAGRTVPVAIAARPGDGRVPLPAGAAFAAGALFAAVYGG